MDLIPAEPVRRALLTALDESMADATFRTKVAGVLGEFPHALHPRAELKAAAMAIGAFEAAGGHGGGGILAGAAMEVLLTGCHVLDRLADGDRTCTPADLQIAPAMLFLAGNLLERARRALGAASPVADWSPVYERMTAACAGQQMDIDLQSRDSATLEEARTMTELKSRAFAEAMALAGAIAAGASAETKATMASLGRCLGTRSQLLDDASDASTAAPGTSDIRLRKKTVPLVYFLTCGGGRSDWDRLRDRFLAGGVTPEEEGRIRKAVEETGAVSFALTLANWYRIKAEGILEGLRANGCETAPLRLFMAEAPSPAAPTG